MAAVLDDPAVPLERRREFLRRRLPTHDGSLPSSGTPVGSAGSRERAFWARPEK
jgi:hypothetical protein